MNIIGKYLNLKVKMFGFFFIYIVLFYGLKCYNLSIICLNRDVWILYVYVYV